MRTVRFENVSDYAFNYKYMVFRADADDIMTKWFWGAYNDRNEANEVALEEGGEMWHTDIVKQALTEQG
jgi:hypothetical protein